MTPISYRNYLIAAYQHYETQKMAELASQMPVEHGKRGVKLQTCQGDQRILDIRRTLNELGFERSKMQRQFHENFLQAVCLHLYSDDPDVDMEKIMRVNGWEDLRQSVLCLTPRRFGKTTAVAMFLAAYCICVPNSEQSVFSTGRRASQKLLELVRDMIKKTPWASKIVKCNQEELILEGANIFDRRKIFSYPSCAKTLRGVGGQVLYLEEAAYLDLSVFYEIVVPLLEMETTALIAISTPSDSLNFYSEMFELKDAQGDPFFRTINVSLVCDACKAAGKGASCTHNQDLIPPWKSTQKLDMVRALYADQQDLMQRESMGTITDDAKSCFKSDDVISVMKSTVPLPCDPDYVFIGVDPNGGGSSMMAIVSVVLYEECAYVVGIDTAPTDRHEHIEQLLLQHIRSLRGNRQLREAHFIFLPENNLGQEAEHMRHMVRSEHLLFTVREKKKAGVCTTHDRKEMMVASLLDYFNGKRLHITSGCVCANPKMDANTRLAQTKDTMKKQLIQFRKMVIPGSQPYKNSKYVFTGKAKSGMQDDLVMTLMIAIWWGQQFLERKIPGVPYDSFNI